MFRRDFLTTCIATSSLGLVDIVKLIESGESGESIRIAERAVKYFNDNKIGRTILEDTVLNGICHFYYYEQDKEPYNYSCRYNHVLKSNVPTFSIAGDINWLEKYDTDNKIVDKAFQILEWTYVKKAVDEAMHTFLANGVDRNILVFDSKNDKFTIRMIELMREVGSNNNSPITHLLISPKAHKNIGLLNEIDGIKLISIDQLGVGEEYQRFFEDQLSGTLEYNCTELIIGIAHGKDGAILTQPEEKILRLQLSKTFKDSDGQQRCGVHFGKNNSCKIGFLCEHAKVLLGSF